MNINLNYTYSGTNSPITGDSQTAETNLRPSEQVVRELSLAAAAKGTMFQGDILDIRGNQVSIQVGNNILNALLDQGVNVNIGERISFQVKENNGAKVMITPVAEGNSQTQNVLAKTLEEASLPVTERNLQAVKEMMNHGMPVDKNSMAEMGRILNQFQDANVETIIGLKSHDLPVSEGNITQFEAYQNMEGKLTDQLNNIVTELGSVIEGEEDPKVLGQLNDLLNQINDLVSSGKEETAAGAQKVQPDIVSVQEEAVKPEQPVSQTTEDGMVQTKNAAVAEQAETSQANQSAALTEQAKTTAAPAEQADIRQAATPEQALQAESEQPQAADVKQQLKALLSEITSNIEKNLLLTPEQLSSHGDKAVKELYEKLNETADKLMQILENSGHENSKLMDMAGDMKNNMSFMQDFNQVASYVQLPMKLGTNAKTGELYVMARKEKRIQPDGPLTAFLHLDMDALGATDVRVALYQGKITTKFTLDNDDSMRLVEEHLPELQKRLENLGYSVSLSVEEAEKKTVPFEQILEADKPTQTVKRFSFDVRA
jgi:hypothetical protein